MWKTKSSRYAWSLTWNLTMTSRGYARWKPSFFHVVCLTGEILQIYCNSPFPQATAIPTLLLLQTNLKRNLFPVIQHPSHTQASYNDSLNLLRSLQWWLRCVASTSPSVLLPWASHCHSHSLTWRRHPCHQSHGCTTPTPGPVVLKNTLGRISVTEVGHPKQPKGRLMGSC